LRDNDSQRAHQGWLDRLLDGALIALLSSLTGQTTVTLSQDEIRRRFTTISYFVGGVERFGGAAGSLTTG